MRSLTRSSSLLALVASAALALGACGPWTKPPPIGSAEEAATLDDLVPLIEELGVTDFEDSAQCRNLGYGRGMFGDLAQDGCERAGTVQFDAVALADHARLADAFASTNVMTDRVRGATFDATGKLQTAWFVLSDASIADDYAYLYDPAGTEPKVDGPGGEFTRLDADWWFVRALDD